MNQFLLIVSSEFSVVFGLLNQIKLFYALKLLLENKFINPRNSNLIYISYEL